MVMSLVKAEIVFQSTSPSVESDDLRELFREAVGRRVSIAAAGCLGERIQTGHRPVNNREVQVDPCFDELGGDHAK
jgi:hypothetical protein